jgi:hypothetical protein
MGKRAKLNYRVEQVEPRLLLSADLAMGFTPGWSPEAEPLQSDLELLPPLEAPAEPDKSTHQNKTSLTLPAALDLEALSNLGAPSTAESEAELAPNAIRNELIVIDGSIADYHQLLEGLQSQNDPTLQREVHVIDPSADGVQILTDLLSNYNNLDAVHIVSHGDTSGIALGASRLDSNSLADYEQSINAWSSALTDGADLLLYGCNLAQGQEGQAFIDGLSALTGADVAASDDSTGHAILGGDWDLEYSTGDVETTIAFDLQAQQNWLSVLPITSRETVDADGDGMVDHIKMTASGAFNDDFSDLNVTVSGYTLDAGSSYITDLGAGGALDNVFYLKLIESGSADTDATPTVTVAGNSNLGIAGATVATDVGVVATDKAAAVVLSKETADLNGDGFIDAIQVKFSEAILDSTVSAGDWDVAGVTVDPFVSTTNGDTADDADIYITFTDGVLDTGATPDATYTQGTLADLSGNLLASDDTATWWDSDWQNRTRITFDNSASAVNLTDFPVLISLDAANVDFDKIAANGADIRFVDDDGTLLNYEIESWDDTPGSESATIWVKVQSLEATNTDFIHLYYNNTAASTAENAAGVWDTNSYAGAWHLEEQAGGIHDDSTGVHDGTRVNNVYYSGEGRYAQTFDGAGDYVDVADHDDFSFVSGTDSAFSVSAWIINDTGNGNSYSVIGGKAEDNSPYGEYEMYLWNGSLVVNIYDTDGDYIGRWTDNTVPEDSDWHYVTFTYDGSESGAGTTLYIDGVEDAGTIDLTSGGTYDGMSNTTYGFRIGGSAGAVGDNYFTGEIDEVRISSAERTADWVEAEYLSQNGAFAFTSFGGEQVGTTDKAAPVLISASSPQTNGTNIFQAGGQQMDFVFSETLSGTISEANLEGALTFAAGATDGNNLPSIGTGVNPISLLTTTQTNDTVRVTFNINNTVNADLLVVGTHTVQVTDGTNLTDTAGNTANTGGAAVTIAGAPNNAPVANDDTAITTAEDTPATTVNVLANDTDADGHTLSVSAASAGNGSVAINGDGTLTYTPNANYNGSDTITYTVIDGYGGTDTATVDVTVTPVNDAPEFLTGTDVVSDAPNADVYNFASLPEGTLSGTAVGTVVAGDQDGDAVTYRFANGTLIDGVFTINGTSGAITLNQDIDDADLGSFVLTVQVSDDAFATVAGDTATVNVNLTNVNDAPEFLTSTDVVGDAPNADVYNFASLPEGTLSGAAVGTVVAGDREGVAVG